MKDISVIGGGIVGLCCAYFLHHAGAEVTIYDRGDFRDGCSHGNAGMLVPSHIVPLASPGIVSKGIQWMFQKKSPFYIRPRFDASLLKWLWLFDRAASEKHVKESAPLLYDMHTESRKFYEDLQHQPGFDFQLVTKGILMMCQSADTEHEEEQIADMAYTLGIDVKKLSHSGVQQLEKNVRVDVRSAFHYTGDAHLDPSRLMSQLISYLKAAGVTFCPGMDISHIEDHAGDGCTIYTAGNERIRSRKVIIAAGAWSGGLMRKSKRKLPMADGKGYAMTFDQAPDQQISIPSILVDSRVAVSPLGNQLRISGTLEISGMDNRINLKKTEAMRSAVSDYYPLVRPTNPGHIWFGYRPCSPDGMPYIGKWNQSSSLILATGHAMMGTSLAPATGRMVKDIIMKDHFPHHLLKLAANRYA